MKFKNLTINCQLFSYSVILSFILFFSSPLKAQVTIGKDTIAHKFSVLELRTDQLKGGLRMPQLSTTDRETLLKSSKDSIDAKGLWIYNTTDNCLEFWNGTKWIGLCSDTMADNTIAPASGNVTTFTNVMYDFQKQTLEAYSDGDGIPTAYRWQISHDNVTFADIQGAPNSNFFTLLPHFADSYFDTNYKADSLYFQCILSNSKGSATTASLNILFIQTEKADGTPIGNYGSDPATGVRYLTIQKGENGVNTPATTGTIKIALLNLGQSDNDDAGDLGDFYQWGRVADGHEHIVWNKDANYINTIEPTGNGATSIAIQGPASAANLDDNGQIKDDDSGFYGNFITSSTSYWETKNTKLWGKGGDVTTRADSDIPLSSWTYPNYQANNPCPGDWSVPSRWNFIDIHSGDGSHTDYTTTYPGGVNNWSWRGTTNNAIGGAIITNADGEKVFLPAAGYRSYTNASLRSMGGYGLYWSSSVTSTSASYLYFYNGYVNPGYTIGLLANGQSVRCVSDNIPDVPAPTSVGVTTFTNVMYDFQKQTLEAYSDGDGIPTAYRWQISTTANEAGFSDITSATSSPTFTIPPHFADSYFAPDYKADSLYFRCILSNSKGSATTASLNILFIQTEKADETPIGNYGIDPATGVRYLTIQTKNKNFPSGTMKMALLNLGQSEDNGIYNNDAGDLGDFYQWGRVKDGHEHIVWSKDASHTNTIDPPTGNGATSLPVISGSQTYDATGQINNDGTGYYGNFIQSSSSWETGNLKLWGNGGADTRAGSDIPLSSPPPSTSSWTYQANNPCPGNWSVPSRWNIWDIFNGDGSSTPTASFDLSSSAVVFDGVNIWQRRDPSTTDAIGGAIGGAIITNADGEKVFLPITGYRNYGSGASLYLVGTSGNYWSSSVYSTAVAYSLRFYDGKAWPGNGSPTRAAGMSVRCVSE